MKSLKNVKFLNFFSYLLGIFSTVKPEIADLNKHLTEPMLSELEIKTQWDDLTNALEKNSAYLAAVKNLEAEPFLKLGFNQKKYYLERIVVSPPMIRSLVRDYTYPSGYVLN